jgi:signal transduction histidine kinase/ligand-binding sensor domain-containing protein
MKRKFVELRERVWFFLSLVLLLTSLPGLQAQRYPSRTYTEADGMANSMVFDVVQDTSGVIWIARRSGITSYDGKTFTNYNVSDGLKSTSYSYLVLDKKSKLWALVESGVLFVSRFDDPHWVTLPSHPDVMPGFGNTYSGLDVYYQGDSAVILAGTATEGLYIRRSGKWSRITTREGLPDNAVHCLKEVNGKIYVGTGKGLALFASGNLKKLPAPRSPWLSQRVLAMKQEGDNLWMLGDHWLGYLKGDVFNLVATGFTIPMIHLSRHCFISINPSGKIYFGNPLNVLYIDPLTGKTEVLKRTAGLISEGANSVITDFEQNTWFAGFRGLTRIPSERFSSFSTIDGLYSNEVASAMEVSPGKYVFGHDCALTYYDGEKMTHFILDPARFQQNFETRVMDMECDAKGDLWLAVSSLGVARVSRDRQVKWYHEAQGLAGIAYSALCMPDGRIFAGTSTGLYQLRHDRFVKIPLKDNLSFSVRKLFPGPGNTVLLASLSMALLEVSDVGTRQIKCAGNPLVNNIYAHYLSSDGTRWVGSAAGLCEIQGDSLVKVNRDGLCINRPVYVIFEDKVKSLWVGTDNGVFRWNGMRLDHFTVSDGLSGHDINRDAGFCDSRGHLWFGTNNGLTVFKPEFDYDLSKIPPPKLSLRFLQVGNDTLDAGKERKFDYDMDDLTFHARVISFIDEHRIFVRYYLEGADTGWSKEVLYTDGRFTYNSLKPGSYRFYLKARNSLGIWSNPVVSATFTIRNPFWLQGWFLGLGLLLFVGIVLVVSRFILVSRYKNRLQEEVALQTVALRQSEKELTESNAAKDSFFSIIAHDLRNPFNVILGYLDLLVTEYDGFSDQQRQEILVKLKSASSSTIDLLENLLTWAQAQRGKLPFNPHIVNLHDLLVENMVLFESSAAHKDIRLEMNSPGDIRVFADQNMISTALRNLISNAIKFTFSGGSVQVTCRADQNGTILVEVKDNGTGMTSAALADLFSIEKRVVRKGTANERGTGLGLILCKEFIEKNGGRLWVVSEKDAGSTFSFTLPAA